MKLVPEVLVIPLSRNPSLEIRSTIARRMLETLVSVISRQSTKAVIKPALQLFSIFLAKRAITVGEISLTYQALEPSARTVSERELWESFVLQLLSWMELSYICPLIGRSVSLIFRELNDPKAPLAGCTVEIWQEWLQAAIARNPSILEDVKNYILIPLFQTDKVSSLAFLEILNRVELPTASRGEEISEPVLTFRLSALELGKKSGLVDEPSELNTAPYPDRS